MKNLNLDLDLEHYSSGILNPVSAVTHRRISFGWEYFRCIH